MNSKISLILVFLMVISTVGFVACSDSESEGAETGVSCVGASDCSSGDYCAKALGDCEGSGSCNAKPDVCPENWAPVCGCDEITYSNTCYAARAGVTIKYEGDCISGAQESPDVTPTPTKTAAPTPIADPCSTNQDCSSDKYCSKSTGDCFGNGGCEAIPQYCLGIWDPVCGCDGKTYSNACYASGAGVSIAMQGECS